MPLRLRLSVCAVLACALALLPSAPTLAARPDLPAELGDHEFWRLVEELSERDGYFRSENLVSNELVYPLVVPEIVTRTKPGGVYLGVGPEQNFTYMAALRPRLAFVVDIRRGNLCLQLLYKALFELSPNRAEFVARLFNLKRVEGIDPKASVRELFDAYAKAPIQDEAGYQANLRLVQDVLVDEHGFGLSEGDLRGIDFVYSTFRLFGPRITWSSASSGNPGGRATYLDLMSQADPSGRALSYLASEETFATVKDLEIKNLVVPVVGDFAGPKALRAIGRYLKVHGATVSAFYLSNVESYLRQDNRWPVFCGNIAALPIDAASVFIRPTGFPPLRTPLGAPEAGTPLSAIATDLKACMVDATR
jgi:hypothetical protein